MEDRRVDIYDRVFKGIDKLIEKNSPCIVAIDGMCGVGKTYLANLIGERYDCNIFHIDDFFLPLEMKTEERLAQAGGNVHYERFREEVTDPLSKNQTVIYRPYICGSWTYGDSRMVEPKRLNIVEGSYSMHPFLREAYDLSIFMDLDEEEQIRRIRERNGEDKLEQFINLWIPLENKYFNELNIRSICDIRL